MFNTYMKYTAVLISLYLIVTHASGFGTAFTQGASGLSQIDKTLQGR
jgi:hypothetical protein